MKPEDFIQPTIELFEKLKVGNVPQKELPFCKSNIGLWCTDTCYLAMRLGHGCLELNGIKAEEVGLTDELRWQKDRPTKDGIDWLNSYIDYLGNWLKKLTKPTKLGGSNAESSKA